MSRPLRIQYPGAFYHVTSRGNERKLVFQNSRDREKYLSYLESAHDRYGPGDGVRPQQATRKICIYLNYRRSGLNLKEIGEYFGMQRSAIGRLSRRSGKTIKGDQKLRKVLDNIEKEGLLNVAV